MSVLPDQVDERALVVVAQIGQIVRHRFYPFRGVIFDVDPQFANTDEYAHPDAGQHPDANGHTDADVQRVPQSRLHKR